MRRDYHFSMSKKTNALMDFPEMEEQCQKVLKVGKYSVKNSVQH